MSAASLRTACHGTDGKSPGSIGKLDGIDRAEFPHEMKEFKYEPGKGRIMGPIARGLSDAQSLSQSKPGSKVLIVDAKDGFAKHPCSRKAGPVLVRA